MLNLRQANEDDLPLILAWRNNPLIFLGFYTQDKPIEWSEHWNWYHSRNQDWREFIIIFDDRAVGVVTIGQLDHWSPEIGYLIGEITLWGQGIGKKAVGLALQWLKEYGKQYAHTTILDNNKRSINLIKALGFRRLGKARDGESWYQIKLS